MLEKWIEKGTVPHALLFNCEKTALQFASRLSSDIYIYKPEGKMGLHSMEMMRQLIEEANSPPFQAKRKVFVIFSAHQMLAPSANALLKTLEEPPSTSTIILVSHHPEKLLPTLRSRCQSYFQDIAQPNEKYLPLLGPLLKALPTLKAVDLIEHAAKLAALIEAERTVEIQEDNPAETAYHRHLREKEEEGKEALQITLEIEKLFNSLLSWYRDLHAVHLGYPSLLQPTLKQELLYRSDRGAFPCLTTVQRKIAFAKECLSRSLPLKHVLESLLFSLKAD